jgi:hypothetical protein
VTREQRREEARKDVALMRELGMLRWGAVWLGPAVAAANVAPMRERTAEEIRAHELAIAQRQHDTLFAASSMKPRMRPPVEAQTAEDNERLSRVVTHREPRAISPEHAGGTKKRTA